MNVRLLNLFFILFALVFIRTPVFATNEISDLTLVGKCSFSATKAIVAGYPFAYFYLDADGKLMVVHSAAVWNEALDSQKPLQQGDLPFSETTYEFDKQDDAGSVISLNIRWKQIDLLGGLQEVKNAVCVQGASRAALIGKKVTGSGCSFSHFNKYVYPSCYFWNLPEME